MKKLPRHSLSMLCGDMTPEEFIAFQDSIITDGVQEPALKWQGAILDGWHRYSTAIDNGLACPVEEFEGTEDEARALVLRKHNRRNWTPSQRAMAVTAIAAWHPKAAPGAASFLSKEAPGAAQKLSTQAQLAADADTSVRTIRQAQAVERRGTSEVKQAVMDGTISLKKAESIARKPKAEQKAAITSPPAPAWRPAGNAPLPRPQVGISKQEADELREAITVLTEENERLNDRLAVMGTNGETTDEERLMYSATLAELRSEIKTLTATLNTTKAQCSHYMEERNELLKQCAMYRNQLAKLSK